MKKILSLTVLCLISAYLPRSNSESVSAYTLAGNLQQSVTSTALIWVSADKDFKNYDDAVVGAYESGKFNKKKSPFVILFLFFLVLF